MRSRFFILIAIFIPAACLPLFGQPASTPATIPSYLKGYEAQYARNPRLAAQDWFRDARFGLFIHYGLASLLPGGKKYADPNALIKDKDELEKQYTAKNFDADAIADLAQAAGMRYICFTPYHGGGPYNFASKVAHPNTVDDLPARRDLVGELAAACRR